MAIFNRTKSDPIALEEQQRLAEQREAELIYRQGVVTMRDLIAPPSLEIESGYIRLGKRFAKTVYVYGYPRQVFTGWLSPLINLDEVIDISIYVYAK
jgi:conjugal transfer ATP-binding protein TraC